MTTSEKEKGNTMNEPMKIRMPARTLLLVAVLLLAVVPQVAVAGQPDKQPLHDFDSQQPLTGTFSMLERGDDEVATRIRTTGSPGHALTIWYVLFNAPEHCNTGACGEDDLFVGGDPKNGFNTAQIEAARISVVFGGDGDVINPGGRVALDGGLAEGEVPSGPAQVVIGLDADGALARQEVTGAVTTGLEDAQATEIHIVLQDHGPAHEDPELLESQLTGFRTACNPTPASDDPPEGSCDDVQFAVHK